MVKSGNFDVNKFFVVLLLSFVTIQVASYLLHEFTDYQFIKMGWIFLLFFTVIGMVSLFTLGRKLGQLELKKDGIFILFVFIAIIFAFIFLPKYIPQIFSIQSLEIGEYLKSVMNSVIQLNISGVTI